VDNIALGILAGGRGRRMTGRDKGLLVIDGQPLVARIVQGVGWPRDRVLVSCRSNPWVYAQFAEQVVCDAVDDGGPVAGIIGLLAVSHLPLVAVAPCDQSPQHSGWINQLFGGISGDSLGCYASDEGRHTPCSLLRRESLPQIEVWYHDGGRSLLALYKHLGLSPVDISGVGTDIDYWSDLPDRNATSPDKKKPA